jgi:predicted nucleic acid-binding protein
LPCEDTLLAAQCIAKGHTLVTDHAKLFELLRPLGWVVENPLM